MKSKFENDLKNKAYESVPDRWEEVKKEASEIIPEKPIKLKKNVNYKQIVAAAASLIVVIGCGVGVKAISGTKTGSQAADNCYDRDAMEVTKVLVTDENGDTCEVDGYIAYDEESTVILDENGEVIAEAEAVDKNGTVVICSGVQTTKSQADKSDEEYDEIQTTKSYVLTTTAAETAAEKGVYVMTIYQNNFPDPLSDTEANEIRSIIGKYSMNTHSWDNLPDYTIIIDGTYYSYETSSGIITRDDTHADKLSEADKNVINKIIKATEKQSSTVVKETVVATVGHPATVTNLFIIKEVNGKNLIMSKYEAGNGELKEGLYSGNYGNLDGSADMHFNVGDIVTVRYDYDIQETYPMGITIREIYPAQWN